jgi:hypothetical protein
MGLADMINPEDRIEVTKSEFYDLVYIKAKLAVIREIFEVESNVLKAGDMTKKLLKKR